MFYSAISPEPPSWLFPKSQKAALSARAYATLKMMQAPALQPKRRWEYFLSPSNKTLPLILPSSVAT
jgi:hypothetical protein